MAIAIHFVARSSNKKIGSIPATTLGREGCPPSCAFFEDGCFGEDFHQRMHWDKVSSGERNVGLDQVCTRIESLPTDQVWRHAVTGDIAGRDEHIDAYTLGRLVRSNAGRPVIAYTHADPAFGENAKWIKAANDWGFTLNMSANNPAHADRLADLGIAPVVTALPKDAPRMLTTPAGRTIATCPATYKDTTCGECKLCARGDRAVIVGFPAHGGGWKKVDFVARQAA